MFKAAIAFAVAIPCLLFASGEKIGGFTVDELERASFTIEDSRCYIGIAKVKLSVGELTREDGNLVGDYTIKVPLMDSKNDNGRIVLPLNSSVEELGREGGILYGKAYSNIEGTPPHKIICEVRPQEDSAILLAITTQHRTINFESRYQVIAEPGDG